MPELQLNVNGNRTGHHCLLVIFVSVILLSWSFMVLGCIWNVFASLRHNSAGHMCECMCVIVCVYSWWMTLQWNRYMMN